MAEGGSRRSRTIVRHPLWLRVAHWITAFCLIGLFMSGLQIFDAHPALYFGSVSHFSRPALAIDSNDDATQGYVAIGGRRFDTTGVLGVSGDQEARAFPRWITLPADQDLATGRRWHFLFAWILVANLLAYFVCNLVSGRFDRELFPHVADLRAIPHSIAEHLRLRFATHAPRYNPLQKIAYAAVVCAVLPIMILAGLAMSPGMDAAAPLLPEAFGGRQGARTVHFVLAFSLLAFFLVHVVMVLLAGPIRELRSMITGRMSVDVEETGS